MKTSFGIHPLTTVNNVRMDNFSQGPISPSAELWHNKNMIDELQW